MYIYKSSRFAIPRPLLPSPSVGVIFCLTPLVATIEVSVSKLVETFGVICWSTFSPPSMAAGVCFCDFVYASLIRACRGGLGEVP